MDQRATNRDQLIATLGETFRECGFAGTSLSEITKRTGLGKSSLYHFFPKGKSEMAEAVLNNIDTWFQDNVFIPLRNSENTRTHINNMFTSVDEYFQSGQRICLVGAFAIDNTRDLYALKVKSYFKDWINALALALKQIGYRQSEAKSLAEDIVASIQGGLIIARSQNDPSAFTRTLNRLRNRVEL